MKEGYSISVFREGDACNWNILVTNAETEKEILSYEWENSCDEHPEDVFLRAMSICGITKSND